MSDLNSYPEIEGLSCYFVCFWLG